MILSREIPVDFIRTLESILQIDLREPVPRKLKPIAASVISMAHDLNRDEARERLTADSYLDDSATLKAYLLYYTTANLLRIHHPLDEMDRSAFFNREKLRTLDFGTGTGTMLAGLELWLRRRHPGLERFFTAVDRSVSALDCAKDIMDRMVPGKTTTVVSNLSDLHTDVGPFDLITAGNVLNELDQNQTDKFTELLVHHLTPDGFVVLIEPALRSTSRRLLELRDRLLQSGWFVYAPCFTAKPCPALVDPGDWCHHTMDWERPKFIKIIDEMVGHIKKSLKFSYMILSRRDIHLGDFVFNGRDFNRQFRAVSESFKEKGRRRIFLCNDCGRLEFQKNKRDTVPANKPFDDLQRYDIVEMENCELKGNLGRVGKETVIRRPGRPGGPSTDAG